MSRIILIAVSVLLPISALAEPADAPVEADAPVVQQPATDVSPVVGDGLWVAVGPNNTLLPAGVYRFIFVPVDPTESVSVTTIDTSGGSVPPPPPPPPVDLRKQIAAALQAVTEVNKSNTAKALTQGYRELVKNAELAGTSEQFAQGANLVTVAITTGRAGWGDFVALISSELDKASTLQQSARVLEIAVEELEKLQ